MRRLALGFLLVLSCGDDDVVLPDAGAATCDDGLFCNGVETGAPGACVAGTSPCAAGERCIELGARCEPDCATPDGDGDGDDAIACGGFDCDDTDARRSSIASEVCDDEGIDEDCDPASFGGLDRDGDGSVDALCCNGEACGGDCDDYRADTRPGATDLCNERDDDCDGEVDEGAAIDGYRDADGDLHGDPDEPMRGCAGWAGFVTDDLDCDDTNVSVHGAQLEIRDGLDNDCDGTVDEEPTLQTWYVDADGDGFGDASGPTMSSDEPVAGHSLLDTDCDDADGERSPGRVELCNGVDDDCDPRTHAFVALNDGEDDDGDGYPDARCPGVSVAVADCGDRDPAIYPDAPERCNELDDDCDGRVDESCGLDGGVDLGGDAGTDMGSCGACDAAEDILADCGCPSGEACSVAAGTSFYCRPRGAGGAGAACDDDADCEGGHHCGRGACREVCGAPDTECPGDRWCSRFLGPVTGLPDALGVCTIACDPIAETGCPSGDRCRLAATGGGYFPYCDPVGTVPLGEACGINPDCLEGTCEDFDGAGRECVAVCGPTCPPETDCASAILTLADGTPFRFCKPAL